VSYLQEYLYNALIKTKVINY